MRLTSVLLPEPEGPVIATHSPATMEKLASASARTMLPWPVYSRVTWWRAMTAQSGRVSESINDSVCAAEGETPRGPVFTSAWLTVSIFSFPLDHSL